MQQRRQQQRRRRANVVFLNDRLLAAGGVLSPFRATDDIICELFYTLEINLRPNDLFFFFFFSSQGFQSSYFPRAASVKRQLVSLRADSSLQECFYIGCVSTKWRWWRTGPPPTWSQNIHFWRGCLAPLPGLRSNFREREVGKANKNVKVSVCVCMRAYVLNIGLLQERLKGFWWTRIKFTAVTVDLMRRCGSLSGFSKP